MHNRVNRMAFAQWTIKRNASAESLDRFIARVCKLSCRLEANPRSTAAERKICRMIESERGCQIDASARNNYALVVDVRLLKSWNKVDARAFGASAAHLGNCHCLLMPGSADGQLVARRETIHVANFDIRCACPRISRKVGAASRRPHFRDRHLLDPVAYAVDIQPDLVANRDV